MSIRRGCRLFLCMAVVGVCACAVTAGTIRHDVDDQLYLDLAAEPDFDSVGKLFVVEGGGYIGGGILVDPWWVLTAAHMVDNASVATFTLNGVSLVGAEWTVHDQWNSNAVGSGYDIALIKLSVPSGLTPAELYTGSSELGMVGVSVGYGRTGTGLTGDVLPSGSRRAGENTIDVLIGTGVDGDRILLADFDSPTDPSENRYGSSVPVALEYMIAPGDSGGGLFVDDGTGYKLAGITSYLTAGDGVIDADYGDVAGYTRVSTFVSWIETATSSTTAPVVGDANLDGTVDLQDFGVVKSNFGAVGALWTEGDFNGDGVVDLQDFGLLKTHFGISGGTAVPEPATALLILLGGAVARRRRPH